MKAILDGDIFAFRCAASAEGAEEWVAIARLRELIENTIGETVADEYQVFLTGHGNFRYELFPDYKANRRGKPLPTHLNACRTYLKKEWAAVECEGWEADDALGMAQNDSTILCSIDKDLKQLSGKHYNFVKKEFDFVKPHAGLLHFYSQLLIGDNSDNIKGVNGIGPVRAKRMLEGCQSEQELFDVVRSAYNDDARLLLNGRLMYVWRTMHDDWTFGLERLSELDEELLSESMPLTEAEAPLSTVRGTT
jgi:DNA polymerase-1